MVWDLLAMLKLMLDDLCDLLQHSACVRYSLARSRLKCSLRAVLFFLTRSRAHRWNNAIKTRSEK